MGIRTEAARRRERGVRESEQAPKEHMGADTNKGSTVAGLVG